MILSRDSYTIHLMKLLIVHFLKIVLLLTIPCRGYSRETIKYLKSVYSSPLTFDPIRMNDVPSLLVGNLIYEGLLRFKSNLEIEGALAKNWSTSKDGKTITFELREDIFFHDGSPIKASDVEYSLRRNFSSKSLVRKYYECLDDVVEVNEKEIKVVLKNPFPPFLKVLAGATAKIHPKKYSSDVHSFNHPIGSGPFKLEINDKTNQKIILKSFDQYYRGKPKLDELHLIVTPEKEAISAATEGKIHDLANWPLSSSNRIFETGQKFSSPSAATWIIGLNTLFDPFKSKSTRQSFKASFDYDGFRKKFYPDAYAAFGYIPPGLPGYKKTSSIDLTPLSNINKTPIKIAIPEVLEKHDEMKKFIETSFATKGWNVEVIPMEWNAIMKNYQEKRLQGFLVSMNIDYPDTEFMLLNFESQNPDNFSSISNSEIDILLKDARRDSDRESRIKKNLRIVTILEEESVTLNLFHPRTNYWVSSCVKNFEPNMLADIYIDYSKVELDHECPKK